MDISRLYWYRALITAVYDGDTVTADIDAGFKIWLKGEKLRLSAINAPELRGGDRAAGLASRDFLRSLVLGEYVWIRTHKRGKYGRYLADIWLDDGRFVNLMMIEAGHAVEY